MSLRHIILAVLPVVGAVGAHRSLGYIDPVRHADAAEVRHIFVPSPAATKFASLGFDMVVADLLWIRTLLFFSDFLDDQTIQGAKLTRAVLKTVGMLDPYWRTPFFYGGGMLRMLGDVEASDEIFSDGMKAFPEDAYFPFSLAMNAYLIRDDVDSAVHYLTRAAALPGAPDWYRNAAAEFISSRGQRKAALLYLKEQVSLANSERERQVLLDKYNSILYQQVVEVIEMRQDKWQAQFGRPLQAVDRIGPLPPDPLGGEWIVAPDGRVRSTVYESVVARKARNKERSILVNP